MFMWQNSSAELYNKAGVETEAANQGRDGPAAVTPREKNLTIVTFSLTNFK